MIAHKASSCFGLALLLMATQGIAAAPVAPAAAEAPQAALAPYFEIATPGPTKPDEDGFIRRWLLLEPIAKPNRTNTVFIGTYVRQALTKPYFPGQFARLPRPGDAVTVEGTPLRWHALDSTSFDIKLFNFAQALGKVTYGVIFYTVTMVDSPRDRTVRLAVGSNSASMWWVNGTETAVLFNDRRMVMDDVVSRQIRLKKGRNVIWGAIINGPGLSDFCVRFLDESGEPVTDLSVGVI
ncbi:MAG TPA: acetylxylan esterase [Sphingobium sp.]|nr:acetylxylan esterase [Sphingobium sp.]